MDYNKLAIISKEVKLRNMSQTDLEHVSFNLLTWLDKLLSLNGDRSAERLEILLPVIKDIARNLNKADLHECFVLYVKGELDIEPTDNYLTVIQFGKIIKAYFKWKTKENKKYITPEDTLPIPGKGELDRMTLAALRETYTGYRNNGVIYYRSLYLYHIIVKRGIFKLTPEQEVEGLEIAAKIIQRKKINNDSKNDMSLKEVMESASNKAIINIEFEKIALRRYFETIANINEIKL